MEKHNYSKPYMAMEKFEPQEFVAGCAISSSLTPVPVSTSNYYKVDGINTDGTHNSSKLDGAYNTSEQITSMKKLDNDAINNFFVKGNAGGYYFHIHQAYTSVSGVTYYESPRQDYSDSRYFGGPVAVMHQTYGGGGMGTSWFLLSNTYNGDNIDSYMSSIKNIS